MDRIELLVKRGEVILDNGWIDSRSEPDLISDIPRIQELAFGGLRSRGERKIKEKGFAQLRFICGRGDVVHRLLDEIRQHPLHRGCPGRPARGIA